MLIAFSLAVAMCVVFYMIVRANPWFALAAPVIYTMITSTMSVAYVEIVPSFLAETSVVSVPVGAWWRSMLYSFLVTGAAILGGRLTARFCVSTPRSQVGYSSMVFFALVALGLLGLQLVNVLGSGLAFSGDRHGLWLNIPLPALGDILGVLVIFVPFYAGVLVAHGRLLGSRKIHQWGKVMILAYFLYLLASSQAFHGLLLGGMMFIGPAYVILARVGKMPQLGIIALASIFIAVILVYGMQGIEERGIGQLNGGEMVDTALYRILVLQGGVYYTADMMVVTGAGRASTDLLLGDMSVLLQTLLSPAQAMAYELRNINLAGSLAGSAVLVFGFFGALPILMFYGLLLGMVCVLIMRVIEDGYGPAVFLAGYLMLWTNTTYVRGSFDLILDPKYFAAVILIAAVFVARRRAGPGPAATV